MLPISVADVVSASGATGHDNEIQALISDMLPALEYSIADKIQMIRDGACILAPFLKSVSL